MGYTSASHALEGGASYWDNTPRQKKIDKPGIIGKLFSELVKPFTAFSEIPSGALKWNMKTNATTIATQFVTASSSIYQVFSIIISAVSKGSAATENIYPDARVNKIAQIAGVGLRYLKIAYVGMIAWSVTDIFQQIMRLQEHTVDASLRILKNISDIGFSTSTMIAGLQDGGFIASSALKCIPILNIGAAVLSAAEFFLHLKSAMMHKKNVAYLKNCADNLADIKQILKEIRTDKTKNYFENKYGVSGKEMRRALRKISREAKRNLKSSNPLATRMKGRNALSTTLHNLRTRAKMNVYESQMSMIAALVGTVALVILAFSPMAPLAVLGLAMLAVSAGLHATTLIHERVSHHRFRKSLGLR